MSEVLRYRARPVEIEARKLTRQNISEIARWIHAQDVIINEDKNSFSVTFELENGWQMEQPAGDFICKNTKQDVWNATKQELDEEYDRIG